MINKLFNVSLDPVIFSIKNNKIHVLLYKRKSDTFDGFFALPGGLLKDSDISMENGINRILKDKTGVTVTYSEQLYTRTGHDPRGATVSIAYIALVNDVAVKSDSVWMEVDKALKTKLAFDHTNVIKQGLARLTNKVNYSTLPMYLLEKKFTLPQLQVVYETILNEKLDKSSFRKKIENSAVLIDTGNMIKLGAYRPAKLYTFKQKDVFTFDKNLT